MILMLETMTTLMETYHSRYMALVKEGWKEKER